MYILIALSDVTKVEHVCKSNYHTIMTTTAPMNITME